MACNVNKLFNLQSLFEFVERLTKYNQAPNHL